MRFRERVEEWDRRHLPPAAARVRSLGQRLRERTDRWNRARHEIHWLSPRDLETRFGDLRPLAAVRELPQLGFIAIALVLLAGTVTAVARHDSPPAPTASDVTAGQIPEGGPVQLGPIEGTTVTAYAAEADSSVARAAQRSTDSRRTALVSLVGYRTAAQAVELLAGVDVRRVYLRAAAGGQDASLFPVEIRTDLAVDLQTGYTLAVRNRQAARKSYLGYVATTDNDKPYQRLYQSLADGAGREAQAFAAQCACVFAAVVEAPVAALVLLRARSGVRTLEVADRVVGLRDVIVQPLLPEARGRVVRTMTPGDPSH